MDAVDLTYWRQWAILLELYRHGSWLTTSQIPRRVDAHGWKVWPREKKTWSKACRHVMRKLERNHEVERRQEGSHELSWRLTEIGERFVSDFLKDNSHITPKKFEEAKRGSRE